MENKDEVIVFFGEPALIFRNGVERWRNKFLPVVVVNELIEKYNTGGFLVIETKGQDDGKNTCSQAQ